ncbi:MAG: hypothetical protein FD153_1710 [Rhodospirillaceae bacterium]|nr:MAG: hypothetical protein FD153_1710 [Rhodospirillaceae bacterium]
MPAWTKAIPRGTKAQLATFQDSSEGALLATGEHLRETNMVLRVPVHPGRYSGRMIDVGRIPTVLDTLTRVSDMLGEHQRAHDTVRIPY